MKTAELFRRVMDVAWDGSHDATSRIPVALAAYAKSHAPRINIENAFDILALYWGDADMALRRDEIRPDADYEAVWDVTFADGSQAMIFSRRGLGDSVEC